MSEDVPLKLARRTINNSLEDLLPNHQFGQQMIAQPFTFSDGMSYTPFTLNRIALSYGYMSYGLVQTVIDQPVEDAFRGGLTIESKELDEEDIKTLMQAIEENNDLDAIKDTARWARLYGGAGLIINTGQNPSSNFREKGITEGSELAFIAADRWELILSTLTLDGNQYGQMGGHAENTSPFQYYNVRLHNSRVITMQGRTAPAFIRQRLQGWGMSELERCMREINTYIKFQNLLFELVDEAKIDVYKIEQFNNALASATGTAAIQTRIQLSNMIKNYRKAVVMDKEDEYEQKQIAFSGLADLFEEFRINLCSALKIPYNKLFGQSATGFSSGADSMENYNAMIDADVRDKVRPLVRQALKLRMRQVFGYEPEFTFKFAPLRVLDETQEEENNTKKQARAMELYDRDLLNGQETMQSLHKSKLLNVDSEVMKGTREPISPLEMEQESNEAAAKNDATKAAAAGKSKKNGMERLAQMLRFESKHHARRAA